FKGPALLHLDETLCFVERVPTRKLTAACAGATSDSLAADQKGYSVFSWMISRSCRFPRWSASTGGGLGASDSSHWSSRVVGLLRVARIILGMTVTEILARLKSLGDDARRAHNTHAG